MISPSSNYYYPDCIGVKTGSHTAAGKCFVGAAEKDGQLLTNGGRVLGVTAVAGTLSQAIRDAYALVDTVHFDNAFYRHDIGARALMAKEAE